MRQIQISPVTISGPIQPFGLDLAFALDKGLALLHSLNHLNAKPIDPQLLLARATMARQVKRAWLQPRSTGGWQLSPVQRPAPGQEEQQRPEGSYMIAVVGIQGPLTMKEDICSFLMDGTSYEGLNAQWDAIAAMARAGEIDGVLLDTHSPGGMVYGSMDCVDKLYGLQSLLPVHALVRDECCSAALLMTTAAERVSITQTSEIGHAGVYRLHQNEKKALDKMGVEITAIFAGEYKMLGNWWNPLSAGDRKLLQKDVDYSYNLFMRKVARNRNMPVQDVVDTQALVYRGSEAVDVGFADEKDVTFEQALDSLASAIQSRRQGQQPASFNKRRGNAFGSQAKRSRVMPKKYPQGMFAAVALALSAASFGQGAELQQLGESMDGKDVAIYEQGNKSFMVSFDAKEVESPENAARAIDDREFTAKLGTDTQEVMGFVPVPVGFKPGAAGADVSALTQRATAAEGALQVLSRDLLGKEYGTAGAGAAELQAAHSGLKGKYIENLTQLGTYRGKLTPAIRNAEAQKALKGGHAALQALELKVSQGAPMMPQAAASVQQPSHAGGANTGTDVTGNPAVSISGNTVTGMAGPVTREQWASMTWSKRAEVRQKDEAQYEELMKPMRDEINSRELT